MQFRNFFFFLGFWSAFLLFSQNLQAQEVTQNKHGERIIIFPNGNWEYFDESKPLHRAILKEYQAAHGETAYSSKGNEAAIDEYQLNIELAEEELALAEEKVSDAKFSKLLLEEELEELKADESASEDQYQVVKKQLKLAARLEKETQKTRKKAAKNLKKLKKNKGKKSSKKKKKFSFKKKSKKASVQENKPLVSSIEDNSFYSASKKFKKYKIEEDVMYNPPSTECNLVFDDVDDFLGRRRKDVEQMVLFNHTDDDMRRYMKNDDYIICEGNLTQIEGGVLFLNLFISINTNDAQRSFGELAKGSSITIKMIDGSKVVLTNNQSDNGVFNSLKRKHVYTGQYRINSGQEKKLKNAEVDFVRVIWETGYEDYEVYNIDFFRDQFRCLNK